ncbi:phosphoethanolamine--lipid A transferase [Rheinheimera texasensis]|jgi:lipid A ethanolaminephosphotransferase|uniref:phosphoethanolamine transferase n=1 Tax=Rheinheimera texasensis TaxID=306205 RepID=UPI0032B23991
MFKYVRRYYPLLLVPDVQRPAHSWHPFLLMLIAAASMTLMLNGPFYAALQTQIPGQTGLQLTLILLVFILNLTLLLLFAHGRMLKPIVLLLFLAGSLSLYFNQTFGVLIDKDMLQNAIETDPAEARGLMSGGLTLHLLQWMLFPLLLVTLVRVQRLSRKLYWQQLLAAFTLVLITLSAVGFTQYAELASFFRNFKSVKHLALPVSPVIAGMTLAAKSVKAQVPREFHVLATDASRPQSSGRPKLLVLVVGETARADHFQLNGYPRPTNPLLSKLPVVSFSQVSSCGTATAHSLPCMFSAMTRDNYDEATAKTSSNILDILQATGVDTRWFDNNSGCKGVCDRVQSEFLFQQPDARCKEGQCLDDVLLDGLARALKTKTDTDRIIVLHQLGSHGPEYFKRSAGPDKVFGPECQDKQLQLCDRSGIINAYDNSIVATDRLLASIIAQLQQQEDYNAAMLYMSDHGESLGENGVYLHGLPYFMAPQAQTHIPLILWMSSSYEAIAKLSTGCLAQSQDKPLSHDHLFHSLLGAFDVRTSIYQQSLDMFNGCKVAD